MVGCFFETVITAPRQPSTYTPFLILSRYYHKGYRLLLYFRIFCEAVLFLQGVKCHYTFGERLFFFFSLWVLSDNSKEGPENVCDAINFIIFFYGRMQLCKACQALMIFGRIDLYYLHTFLHFFNIISYYFITVMTLRWMPIHFYPFIPN